MAVMIDDTTGIRGWERQLYQDSRLYEVISEESWLAKVKAAMKACEGTDCMLIARTEPSSNMAWTRRSVDAGTPPSWARL